MTRSYAVHAIVFSRKKLGEADLLLTIFSKEKGKLAVIAKGVRKVTSRKRGTLDTFSLVKLQLAKTKSLDIVTESELIDSFHSWKKNLKKVALAYYLVEIVDKLTREGEPHYEVFDYLCFALESLGEIQKLRTEKEEFSKNVLVSLGFWRKNSPIVNSQELLESIIEKRLFTPRVGKRLLS